MNCSICHGDYRLDNLFFDYDKDGSGALSVDPAGEPQWCVIDWQLVMATNPAFELSYFISQSVTNEFRLAHEKQLLQAYYLELTAEGSGVTKADFPYAVMLHHYQAAQVRTLSCAASARSQSVCSCVHSACAQRVCTACVHSVCAQSPFMRIQTQHATVCAVLCRPSLGTTRSLVAMAPSLTASAG